MNSIFKNTKPHRRVRLCVISSRVDFNGLTLLESLLNPDFNGRFIMKNGAFLWFFLLLPFLGNAEEEPLDLELESSTIYRGDSKGFSWMYNKNYRYPDEWFENECQRLAEELLDLHYEPNARRRLALQQRYDAECLGNSPEE